MHRPRSVQATADNSTSAIAIEHDQQQHHHLDDGDQPIDLNELPANGIDGDDQPILPHAHNSPLNNAIKLDKRLEKKRLKQQQKQQKKLNKQLAKERKRNETISARANKTATAAAKTKPDKSNSNKAKQQASNLKPRSIVHSVDEPQVPSSKQNVKFAIDTVDNGADVLNGVHRRDQCGPVAIIENGHCSAAAIGATYAASNHSGDYDALPAIQLDQGTSNGGHLTYPCNNELYDGNGNVIRPAAITVPIGCSSSDSIPFVGDGLNARRAASVPVETRANQGLGRFITLQPRGIGAQGIIYARKIEKHHLPIAIKVLPKRDQFDKSAQILYQSLKESIDHHFERAAHLNSKLCQVCHEFLLVPDAVKCLTCGLVCHHSCTIPQVSKQSEIFGRK